MQHRPESPTARDIARAGAAVAWFWLWRMGVVLTFGYAIFWFCTSRSPQ